MRNELRTGPSSVITFAATPAARWPILLIGILAVAAPLCAEPTPDQLIQQLKAKSPADRRTAAVALGKLGDPRAVAPLIPCLQDKDRSVARAAAESLVKIGQPALRPLIACLNDTSAEVRRTAVQALGQLRDKQAVGPLVACLRDTEGSVCSEAANVLGTLGDQQATDPLIDCLRDERANVRSAAAGALGKLGDKRAVDGLVACLKDEQSTVRGTAVDALGKLGDQGAVEPLLPSLKDEVPAVRRAVVDALGKLGDKRAVDGLVECLKDEEASVRRTAVEALGKLGDQGAAEAILPCLKDEELAVRRSAVDTLGKLGDKTAVPHLVAALPDWSLGSAIINALKQLRWEPGTERERLYSSIGARDKEALVMDWERNKRLLIEDAESGDARKVENAIYTMISMGRHDLVAELVKILDTSEDPSLCEVYLSCGHPALCNAGKQWATKRGYSVVPGGSSSGPTWGAW
jgi:HEAT repeat protein